MSYKLTKINNESVKELPVKPDYSIPLHQNMFDNRFPNVFICAKKKSGKTVLLWNIIQKSLTNKSKLILFSSTVHNDIQQTTMIKKYEKRGFDIQVHESLFDQHGNILDRICKELSEHIEHNQDAFNKKKKVSYPLAIIVFDDFKRYLRNKSVAYLLSRNRHLRAMVIISSQYYIDVEVSSRENLNYLILFANQSEDKLQQIYDLYINKITFDQFKDIYYMVTDKPYHFLYINTDYFEMRDCFNYKIVL